MRTCKNCAGYVFKHCSSPDKVTKINCIAFFHYESFQRAVEIENIIVETMKYRRAIKRLPPMKPDVRYPIDKDLIECLVWEGN